MKNAHRRSLRSAAQTTDSSALLTLDDLRNTKRTDAGTGQAANAFIGVNFSDDAA